MQNWGLKTLDRLELFKSLNCQLESFVTTTCSDRIYRTIELKSDTDGRQTQAIPIVSSDDSLLGLKL